VGLTTIAVKFVRRHSLEVLMLAAVLVVCVGAGVFVLHYQRENRLNAERLTRTEAEARVVLSRLAGLSLNHALAQGHLAVAYCRFGTARRAFSEAIRIIRQDPTGQLYGDPSGHLAHGMAGYMSELVGIQSGQTGFAEDFKAALDLHRDSELLNLLNDLPDPRAPGPVSDKTMAALAARIPNISGTSIRRLSHNRTGLVYILLAWVSLAGGQPEQALALSNKALADQPNLAMAYFLRAKILSAKGQSAEAAGEAWLAVRMLSPERVQSRIDTAENELVRSIIAFALSQESRGQPLTRPATRRVMIDPSEPPANRRDSRTTPTSSSSSTQP
jgi:tetratricopeptide (TPR) repeat protein